MNYTQGERLGALPARGIVSVAEDADGVLWCALENGGIGAVGESLWWFTPQNSDLPAYRINCVFVDREGRRWFAGARGIVFRFDGSVVERLPTIALSGRERFRFLQDPAGRVWACALCGRVGAVYTDGSLDSAHTEALQGVEAQATTQEADGSVWALIKDEDRGTRRYARIDGSIGKQGPEENSHSPPQTLHVQAQKGALRAPGIHWERTDTPDAPPLSLGDLGLDPRAQLVEILVDGAHDLWVRWRESTGKLGFGRWTGTRVDIWEGTPIANVDRHRRQLQARPFLTRSGAVWFFGPGRTLVRLDERGWTSVPVAAPPPSPFRARDVRESIAASVHRAALQDVIRDPRAYHDRKLSFVGRIDTPGGMRCIPDPDDDPHWWLAVEGEALDSKMGINVDLLQKQLLEIDPATADSALAGLPVIQRGRAPSSVVADLPPCAELVGYLECEQSGTVHDAPYRFAIVEYYPHPLPEEDRERLRAETLAKLDARRGRAPT